MPGRNRSRELQVTRLALVAALSGSVAAFSILIGFAFAAQVMHPAGTITAFMCAGAMSGISAFFAIMALQLETEQ